MCVCSDAYDMDAIKQAEEESQSLINTVIEGYAMLVLWVNPNRIKKSACIRDVTKRTLAKMRRFTK